MSELARMRMLVVADSDSYLKWGVSRALDAPSHWDAEVVVVRNAVTPSREQREAAVDARLPEPVEIGYVELVDRLRGSPPDILLLACRGAFIQLLLEETFRGAPPCRVVVTGIPGIWLPPTELGLDLRAAADLMIVHSERERAAVGARLPRGSLRATGLASLVPVEDGAARRGGRVVFAPQALVPGTVAHRRRLLDGLVETARANPGVEVVIKLRGTEAEAQTHAEFASFPQLAAGIPADRWPANLTFGYGPLRAHLEDCRGFVTVSSTAALEAIAAGVPVLCLDDFGVDPATINVVFEGSGLFGSLDDLVALRFRMPDAGWMASNYFHGRDRDDWTAEAERLAADASLGERRSYRSRRRGIAGAVRRARSRHQALGDQDSGIRRAIARTARTASSLPGALRRCMRRGGTPDTVTLDPGKTTKGAPRG